jgi:hypothetical protein
MFPLEELPHLPAPSPHPALVRAVELFHGHTKARVEVTFGTSKNVFEDSLDLVIANIEEMNEAGLFQSTRFKLDKTRKLPWAEEFFVPLPGKKTPVIGHLSTAAIGQLEALKVQRRRLRSSKPKS